MADVEKIAREDELEGLLERSREHPVWLFKHSVTCGISSGARRRFEDYVASRPEGVEEFALLEVQSARPLSNRVAEVTGVRHQSPQLILLRGGEAVWNTSHGAIAVPAMEQALEQALAETA